MIFKEITFSIAEKMGVYKNNTYFSDDVDDFLPIGFIRKSSNTINLITKKIWYNVEKKSNRAEVVSFGAISFDIGAIRFCFGAIRFCEHTLICYRHVIGKIAGATGWCRFDV